MTNPRDSLTPAQLRHTGSIKWTLYPEDVIPLWVADMDYPVAPPILEALRQRLERPIGYPVLGASAPLTAQLQAKWAGQGLGDVPAEGLMYLPGVVTGLYAAIQALSAPGERVVTVTPIYHPFHLAITELGREVVGVPLRDSGECYEFDWDALDAACQGSKVLMLCHPHNPTGRVWDAEELARLRDLVLKHDLRVICDELHADLRYTPGAFESFAADPRVRDRTVTVTGPCKAFNTAGLGIGTLFSHEVELVRQVRTSVSGLMGHPSALSITMWETVLAEGGPWLAETVAYLRGNHDHLLSRLAAELPWVKFHPLEATYLAWLDLRAHPQASQIQQFMLDEAKVAVHHGPVFAPADLKERYQGFIRLNFATTRALLDEALDRMVQALKF